MSLYGVSEHDRCWRMSQWMQASDVINVPYSVTRDTLLTLGHIWQWQMWRNLTNALELKKVVLKEKEVQKNGNTIV
jgi:plasmid maintenance system antidote protein VapI